MIFSLQKRFLALLLLPVTLDLLILGVTSFIYARSYLLEEWGSMVRLKFEKTAHQVRMRLDRKRAVIKMMADAEDKPDAKIIKAFLAHELSKKPGVISVEVLPQISGNRASQNSLETLSTKEGKGERNHSNEGAKPCCPVEQENGSNSRLIGSDRYNRMEDMMKMMKSNRSELSLDTSQNILTLTENFDGRDSSNPKEIVVRMTFDSLVRGILEVGQWRDSYACLVKSNGQFLAHTDSSMSNRKFLGDTGDPLEKKVLTEMAKKNFGVVIGSGYPPSRVIGFYKVPTTDWFLVLVSSGRQVLAPILHFNFNYILIGALSVLTIGVLISLNTRPIARSIEEISQAAEQIEKGNYSVRVSEDRSDEIGILKRRFNQMTQGLKQRDLIEMTFGRYVDGKVAAELLARPENLQMGGKRRVVTILMADLRGFTKMCEKLRPEDVISLLNLHFSKMIEVIEKYEGIIVDFYGDSVLAFFQGSTDNDNDVSNRALDAVRCALEMEQELETLCKDGFGKNLDKLKMGIGIHTGEVIVGNIGSSTRAKYGIVGSAVNETDRIQSSASDGGVIVSEKTYEILSGILNIGEKLSVRLKGLNGIWNLYKVNGCDPIATDQQSVDKN
ncbi:MAG: adenylate/guanylate cyclase domain-containing protein [Desulfomonilaceae bacterium]